MEALGIRGICYDSGSSYLKGPAGAPTLIRKALRSGMMNLYTETLGDLSSWETSDLGDFEIQNYLDIEGLTREHLTRKPKLFTLGGDHSITYPIVKAYAGNHQKLDLLQIDAHPDLYQHYEGDPYSHACPFARIMEEGLAQRLVQVGIRTLNPHQKEQAERFGVEMYTMPGGLPELPLQFSNPVYVSVDIDALDPAFAPGVSHRESGGLTPREVITLLQSIEGEVVGADLVEYNPLRDLDGMTSEVGAKLMKELLGLLL
ncbi:agmatinase family protein [Robiginitalea sp.]|uniref:agmatinase family protein n=1 Tax=Robiginitalea sp. TaxID=1902411 RepID=UPI003C767D51